MTVPRQPCGTGLHLRASAQRPGDTATVAAPAVVAVSAETSSGTVPRTDLGQVSPSTRPLGACATDALLIDLVTAAPCTFGDTGHYQENEQRSQQQHPHRHDRHGNQLRLTRELWPTTARVLYRLTHWIGEACENTFLIRYQTDPFILLALQESPFRECLVL